LHTRQLNFSGTLFLPYFVIFTVINKAFTRMSFFLANLSSHFPLWTGLYEG
jgi:hypothetical protein